MRPEPEEGDVDETWVIIQVLAFVFVMLVLGCIHSHYTRDKMDTYDNLTEKRNEDNERT